MLLLLKRAPLISLLLVSVAISFLAEASFLERAGLFFSPQAIMKRTSATATHSKPWMFLSKTNVYPNYTTRHRSLREIHHGGAALDVASTIVFDNAPLWKSISTISIFNALGCAISLITGSHLHLDLIGTGAFALAALLSLQNNKNASIPRVRLSSTCVTIWSMKLASFLFFRILRNKHDGRLDDMLSTASGTVTFWIISALWGIICGLPHYIGSTSSDLGNKTAIYIGATLYIVGLLMETIADYQKFMFKKSYPRKFCNVGLWSISQHPNFFGNLLLWCGILIMNAPSMIEPSAANGSSSVLIQFLGSKRIGFALISPLFMWRLFYGQASGSMTNSVTSANERYGDDSNYKKYLETVPLIIPRLFPSWK